jgi:hypothetical protein
MGTAIVAAPLVLWLIVTFVRSNVMPPRVAYRPVVLEQKEPARTVEAATAGAATVGTVADGPSLPPRVAAPTATTVATATADQFSSAFALAAQASIAVNPKAAQPTVSEAVAGEPIAGPVPLPLRRPKFLVAAIDGPVPVPRPRPKLDNEVEQQQQSSGFSFFGLPLFRN